MAANYWESTQRKHWTFTREALAEMRKNMEGEHQQLVSQYPLPDRRQLSIFFMTQLKKLANRFNMRQQVMATAQVYLRRFYLKREIRTTNPFLVLSTAFYLAAKMEECPQHIRLIASELRTQWPDFVTSDPSKMGECEFHLISEMSSQLIIHHPYRNVTEFQAQFGLAQEEVNLAWSIINDHYLTDLPLMYPPHVIAITAILLAVVLKPGQSNTLQAQNLQAALLTIRGSLALNSLGNQQTSRVAKVTCWLADSSIDIVAVADCTQEFISLYTAWGEEYNEKACKDAVGRFVKARGLDK